MWQDFVKPTASSKMDVENQLSHAYILVERMLSGEIALEDFVSSGETKARCRPDVENAIHRNPVGLAPWRFCDSLPAVCAEAAVAFDRVRRSGTDLFCDIGLCGS